MFLQTRTSGILIELTCFREAAGRGNNIGLALNLCAEQLRVAEVPGAEPVNSGKMVSCPHEDPDFKGDKTSRKNPHKNKWWWSLGLGTGMVTEDL